MSVYIPKKFFIKTLGCQANVADSTTLSGILESLGYEGTHDSNEYANEKELLLKTLPEVDLFIVNTCSVRQKSEDKVYGVGKVLKEMHDLGLKKPFIVLAGCMVGSVTGERQRYHFDALRKKTPWVDLYMNPSQVTRLPNLLAEAGVLDAWAMSKLQENISLELFPKKMNDTHAFVNISYGCDNFCSFCVVPYARGAEISRSEDEIVAEVMHLALRGISEITLCGQNVNSWGLDTKSKFKIRSGSDQKLPFASLLRKIHSLETISKISFLSSNPFDFTTDLIDTLSLPKISKYLHIAIQSGNNEILKKMNRRHTLEDFFALIGKIREAVPDIELGTDIIVGFPGETRDQFMDTVDLLEKIGFNIAFISMYSERKGTPAHRLYKDDITLKEKKWRHDYATKTWQKTKPKRKS